MKQLKTLITENSYFCSISMTLDEVSDGLASFKFAIAARFPHSEVNHEEGRLFITLFSVHGFNEGKKIGEWMLNALIEAFPSLDVEPIEYTDEILGRLVWLEEHQGFVSRIELEGNDVDIVLSLPAELPSPALLERPRDIVERWSEWRKAMSPKILDECLSLYNDEWRQLDEANDGRILTADEFLKRLSPVRIEVCEDGSFQADFFCRRDVYGTRYFRGSVARKSHERMDALNCQRA